MISFSAFLYNTVTNKTKSRLKDQTIGLISQDRFRFTNIAREVTKKGNELVLGFFHHLLPLPCKKKKTSLWGKELIQSQTIALIQRNDLTSKI